LGRGIRGISIDYILHVWREKPDGLYNTDYWKAHITNAHALPRVGELLEAASAFDSYKLYRVFEVVHPIPCLADLIKQGREELKEGPTDGIDGLPVVLALVEH